MTLLYEDKPRWFGKLTSVAESVIISDISVEKGDP